jgi:hypothetical protein
MKKVLSVLLGLGLFATNALADTCATSLMPMFNAFQATAICSKVVGSLPTTLLPSSNNAIDLGSASKQFRTLYLGTSLINSATSNAAILGRTAMPADVTTVGATEAYSFSAAGIPLSIARGSADTTAAVMTFLKSRAVDGSADTIVASGDNVGSIDFYGANGATFDKAAQIFATIDNTPGASNDMPGKLSFLTSADGSATPATRWTINSNGNFLQDGSNGGNLVLGRSQNANSALLLGASSIAGDAGTPQQYTLTSSGTTVQQAWAQGTADTNGVLLNLLKSRATDGTADTIVASGDTVGLISFKGANGATFDTAAQIKATIDATPGASNDMPGALDFLTSQDGSSTPSSVLKLDQAKNATFQGGILQPVAGSKITVKGGGAAATSGQFTCNGVTAVVVSTTAAATNMVLAFSPQTISGTAAIGSPYVSAISAATSFSVKCSVAGETSVYNWAMLITN